MEQLGHGCAPQNLSVQQDTACISAPPDKALTPSQSLAEVRAAPLLLRSPGGSAAPAASEAGSWAGQENQKGAVKGLGSWSPKATTNMCLTLVGLISTAQMSARADKRERAEHGCPCWKIMRAVSEEGAESSARRVVSHS